MSYMSENYETCAVPPSVAGTLAFFLRFYQDQYREGSPQDRLHSYIAASRLSDILMAMGENVSGGVVQQKTKAVILAFTQSNILDYLYHNAENERIQHYLLEATAYLTTCSEFLGPDKKFLEEEYGEDISIPRTDIGVATFAATQIRNGTPALSAPAQPLLWADNDKFEF